jgi:hypothetical protein
MLPTIVFGLALLFSAFYIINMIYSIANKDGVESKAYEIFVGLSFFTAIVLWSWLYWLSH